MKTRFFHCIDKFKKWQRRLLTLFTTCLMLVTSLLQRCIANVNGNLGNTRQYERRHTMASDLEGLCPYAPYGNVLTVIKQMRDRGLKEPVTMQLITTAGVAEGNASRT